MMHEAQEETKRCGLGSSEISFSAEVSPISSRRGSPDDGKVGAIDRAAGRRAASTQADCSRDPSVTDCSTHKPKVKSKPWQLDEKGQSPPPPPPSEKDRTPSPPTYSTSSSTTSSKKSKGTKKKKTAVKGGTRRGKKGNLVGASVADGLGKVKGEMDALTEIVRELRTDAVYLGGAMDENATVEEVVDATVEAAFEEASRHQVSVPAGPVWDDEKMVPKLEQDDLKEALFRNEARYLAAVGGPTHENFKLVLGRAKAWAVKHGLDKRPDWVDLAIDSTDDAIHWSMRPRWTADHTISALEWAKKSIVRLGWWTVGFMGSYSLSQVLSKCAYTQAAYATVATKVVAPAVKGLVTAAKIAAAPLAKVLLPVAIGLGCAYGAYKLYEFVTRPPPPRVVITENVAMTDVCCAHPGAAAKEHEGKCYKTAKGDCRPRIIPLGFSITDKILLFRSCEHNLLKAVLKRELLKAIGTTELRCESWEAAKNLFLMLWDNDAGMCGLRWYSYVRILSGPELDQRYENHISGRQKIAWRAAVAARDAGGSPPDDMAESQLFTKYEVSVAKNPLDCDPRLICGKKPEYMLETCPEYYDFYENLVADNWPHSSSLEDLLSQTFIYPAALGPVKLGLFVTAMERRGWHAFELDFSRYDGHTEVEALRAEFDLYRLAGLSPSTIAALEKQLKHTGRSHKHGVKFSVDGKRASGVINTTLGNTLCGFMAIAYALQDQVSFVGDVHIVQMGDDNMVFTRERIDEKTVIARCEDLGHKLKMIYRGCDESAYDALEFCSSVFWDVGSQRVMGPKIARALAKSFVPIKEMGLTALLKHVKGVAESFAHYRWLPVLGLVCDGFVRDIGLKSRLSSETNPYKLRLDCDIDVDKTSVERHFYSRYGMHAENIEMLFADVVFNKPLVARHVYLDIMLEVDGLEAGVDDVEWGHQWEP